MAAPVRSALLRFGVAAGLEVLLLAGLNFFDDWTLAEMPVRFVTVAVLSGLAFFSAVHHFPDSLNPRAQAFLFWGLAIALRLVVLPLQPGDDFWRYQWEGKIQQAGFNPYVSAPDDPQLEPVRAEFPAWHKINHRDFRAIYPPGAELVFAGLSRVSDSPLLYKLFFAGADLATVALLLRLLGGTNRYANAAWYGWNPLVIYSFAGSAHFDSLMIMPMVGGIFFLARFETQIDSRRKCWLALAAATAFGVAISIKLIPALLLLCCLFALRARAVVLAISLAIPWLLSFLYGYPRIPIWESLRQFAHVTRLNDLFWWVIEETVWPNPHQKNYHYNVILLIAVGLISLVFFRNWKRGLLWALGTALILSPVLHPWYCTWILPLATWRRAYPWHVLSVSLFAYFLFWNERLFALPWHSEPWLRATIAIPPLAAGLWLALTPKRDLRPEGVDGQPP